MPSGHLKVTGLPCVLAAAAPAVAQGTPHLQSLCKVLLVQVPM